MTAPEYCLQSYAESTKTLQNLVKVAESLMINAPSLIGDQGECQVLDELMKKVGCCAGEVYALKFKLAGINAEGTSVHTRFIEMVESYSNITSTLAKRCETVDVLHPSTHCEAIANDAKHDAPDDQAEDELSPGSSLNTSVISAMLLSVLQVIEYVA